MSRTRAAIVVAVILAALPRFLGPIRGETPPRTRIGAESGEWWQYRADQRLSGRARIRGNIERPAIAWAHPIAGRETLLAASLEGGPEEIALPRADPSGSQGNANSAKVLEEWRNAGPYGTSWFDLDGDGRLTPVTRSYNQKVGKVLPDVAGLQLIETEAKGYPRVPNVYKGTVRLKVRQAGQWVTRWETETDTLIWQAEPIFGDFDGDGRNEIVLLPWYRLTLLDAATGKLKEQCNYLAEDESENPGLGGRAYGWFGAVDVDGDGQTEFVIIEDFIRYAAIIGRRDGKLQRLWLKVWEPRKQRGETLDPEATVVARVNPEPVQDLDADGRKEIVVSLFNLDGDNRWHVRVLDALTGATKLDLPGQFLTGLRDADSDGAADLFCTAVGRGPRIPDPSQLTIYSLKEGKTTPIWSRQEASFVTYGMGHFPPHVNSGAALGGETILCGPVSPGGPAVFFTRKRRGPESEEVEVTCWQRVALSPRKRGTCPVEKPPKGGCGIRGPTEPEARLRAFQPAGRSFTAGRGRDDTRFARRSSSVAGLPPAGFDSAMRRSSSTAGRSRFRPLATWFGPHLQPLMVRPNSPSILLKAAAIESQPARVKCPGGKARTTVLASQRVPAPISPIVVGRPEPGAPPVIVVQGANETVEAFRPAASGQTKRLWRVPGRGMTCNNYYEGLLLADLDGEGRLSVVTGTRGDGDCARLTVRSLKTGRAVWSRDFEDFPGAPPPWNVPGLMYWQGGYFRDPARMDLLIQMRRVGGESTLLDGRSGEVLWRQSKGRPGRDFGRDWMAMLDFDGDDLEDILNIYPDMFCVARGRDGKLLIAEESVKYVDLYAYYAQMIVADFLGEGQPQVLYCHEAVTALLAGRSAPGSQAKRRQWKLDHPHPNVWRTPAGFGDVDGDGRLDLYFPGGRGQGGQEFQCRDAATGALKWSLPIPDEVYTYPAVADINGDGRDDCLFSMGKRIYAIGSPRALSPGGTILWKLDLPERAGPLTLADVGGKGMAQVVVACADGHVYGIGPSSASASSGPLVPTSASRRWRGPQRGAAAPFPVAVHGERM